MSWRTKLNIPIYVVNQITFIYGKVIGCGRCYSSFVIDIKYADGQLVQYYWPSAVLKEVSREEYVANQVINE